MMNALHEIPGPPRRNGERGFALVLVIVVLMTLMVLGIGMMTSVGTNVALSKNYEMSTQAINMAEIGAKVAYREFINSGFLKSTHDTTSSHSPVSSELRLPTTLQNYVIVGGNSSKDSTGWYQWSWDSSKGYNPLFDTTRPHGFRFRVYYVNNNFTFVIESEGWFGSIHRRTRAKGEVESMFVFAYYAQRDLGEFVDETTQEVRGKVHANGIMYVRPTNADLKVYTSSFTATNFIVRSRDAWGRPDVGGTAKITNNNEGGLLVEMLPYTPPSTLRGSEGLAFDSYNPNWNDRTLGAKALWDGVVRDKVSYKSSPPFQNLEPGGYYETNAGLKITSLTSNLWAATVTFWNWNEQRYVTVKDINVRAMIAAGNWPPNGLIYSNTPIRLSNADSLANKLTVASCFSIYTKGNFNTNIKKGASLMTKHRIYHLSGAWDDVNSENSKNLPATSTTVNAALVDGAPTVDEYNWVDRDGDHRFDFNSGLIYDDWDHKTAAGFHNPANLNDPCANCEDLLENWAGKTLARKGSIIHMNSAIMAQNLNNDVIQANELYWVRNMGYIPPLNNSFTYDPDLATPASLPPYTPLIGHIKSWEPF